MSQNHNLIKDQSFINNEWVSGASSKVLNVLDKYSGQLLSGINYLNGSQTEKAVVAAELGFKEFKKWSAEKRHKHLLKLISLLKERQDDFVDLIVKEAGKPISYARAEVKRCIQTLNLAAIESMNSKGEIHEMDYGAGTGRIGITKRFPIGIILCITPFNFPLNLLLHKVAPALACGCSTLVKPPPQAPLSSLAFADLIKEAGYPNGVYNVLVCDIPEAEALVKNDQIAMLSFTGSDKIGWHLKSMAAKKKVTLELGGNAAVIVDSSTDLEKAAKEISIGAFLYSGQICISTQRIIVLKDVHEEFKKHLEKEIENLVTGNPSDENTIVGPIIDNGHLHRINNWIEEARAGGANIIIGGEIISDHRNLYKPTLITEAPKDSKVVQEEIFGPVAVMEIAENFQEALIKVNDSRYGLQAGIYTDKIGHIKLAHEELEVGGIIINSVPGFRIDGMPYGGVKDSGMGREGLKYAIEDMTEPRLLVY